MSAGPGVGVTVLTTADLIDLLERAAERGAIRVIEMTKAREAADARPISANRAAKLVRRRRSVVLAACRSGELPAVQTAGGRGGRPEWRVRPADLMAWASA